MTSLIDSRLYNSNIALTLLIAAIYILTAKLGFMLAIEPGNVTAIWPPSGIALAATILFGWRSAAGIWFGSLLVNSWTMSGAFALQISISIATGSLLQALIAAKLLSLSRDKQSVYSPSTANSILYFMLVTALTTCIAPTIGAISLWTGGQLGSAALNLLKEPMNSLWWTWWIGDYAGILIFTPACLKIISARLHQQSKDSWLFPISSAILGGTLINFFFILQSYVDNYQQKLDQNSLRLQIHIEEHLNNQLYQLTALNAFFAASKAVERDEFSTFANHLILNGSLAQVLEWIPVIDDKNRQSFEENIRNNDQKNFRIYEKDSANNPIPAKHRDEYFPVLFIEPFAGNEIALGYDLGSEIIRRHALQTARDSGKITATGKLQLVQNANNKHNPSILLANPLYIDNITPNTVDTRRKNLLGFTLALIPIKQLIPDALASSGLDDMFVELHDISAANSPTFMDSNFDRQHEEKNNNISPFSSTFKITFANRQWQFTVRPTRNNFNQLHPDSIWLVLIAGIATMLTVVTYAHGRNQRESVLLHSELENRELLESLPDAVVVVDSHGLIIRSNKQVMPIFGYSPLELLGESVEKLIPEAKRHGHQQSIDHYNRKPTPRQMGNTGNLFARHASGKNIPVDIQLSPLVYNNERVTMAVIRDISEQKNQEKAILELNQTLEQRIIERTAELQKNEQALQEVITTLNRRHDNDRRLAKLLHELQISETLEQTATLIKDYLPLLMPDTYGNILVEINPGQWTNLLHWSCDKNFTAPTTISFDRCACLDAGQYCLRKCTGNICPASQAINQQLAFFEQRYFYCDPRETAAGHRAIVHITGEAELTEQQISLHMERANDIINQIWLVLANAQLRDILKSQALRDGLTGLYNRRFFDDILEKEIARGLRNNTALALAILDIDFFKHINDQYGHASGDEVLKKIAQKLEQHIRSSDYACRFGGEEFVLVLPDCLPEQALNRMESLRKNIAEELIQLNGDAIHITLSIGIAHCPQHGDTANSLLETADKSLYEAKQSGRNRVVMSGEKINHENSWDI